MSMLLQMRNVMEDGRLGPLSADVRSAEVIHLVGPNGAGKSTLLSRLAGLTEGKGTILFNDRPLEQWPATVLARRRAFLAQQQTPPFAMPVWHYLKLHQTGQVPEGLPEALADKLGLSDKLGRQVNQLSGGEWQRVRLCAVILQIHPVGNPHGQLLLLDEPMNSLDVAQQAGLDAVLRELAQAGIAIVMSSHDLNHTLRHANTVWLLRGGEMIACAAADDALTPERLAVAYGMPFRRLEVGGHNILLPDG